MIGKLGRVRDDRPARFRFAVEDAQRICPQTPCAVAAEFRFAAGEEIDDGLLEIRTAFGASQ